MKSFLALVGLALLLSLTGCSDLLTQHHYQYTHFPVASEAVDVVYPVYVDVDFGNADLLSIQQALEQWNFAMNGYAHFRIVNSRFDMQISNLQQALNQHAYLILKISSDNPIVPTPGPEYQPGCQTLGFTTVGGHSIYLVRDRLRNIDVRFVLMHELGHALGARHQKTGLMRPAYDPEYYQCVDADTAQQVATYRGWEARHLNYCVVDGDLSIRNPDRSRTTD